MSFNGLPLIGMIQQKMSWLNDRQTILARNIANASTPGFVPQDLRANDFAAALADTGWTACFVKDYVKSLTTQRGSVARNADEVIEILTLIERYRGALEGGVCLREFEPLKPETEERYFVLDGRAFDRNGEVPALVHEVARRVPCPFFSVDLVASETGALRLVELGDGQVSDRKQWPADRFVAMLQSARG